MSTAREHRLTAAFVRAADTLVDDYDPFDLLQQLAEDCVDLFAVDTAGLLLGDHRGELRLAAATSDGTRLLELFQLEVDEGPCLDAFTTGTAVLAEDLATHADRWPSFAAAAVAGGFRSVHALPLRLRSQTIGVVGLFSRSPGGLAPTDVQTAQALADVATIGVLHQRFTLNATVLSEQLQSALNTRVVVEQAKGVVAERVKVPMDEAFQLLRAFSRQHNRSLRSTAAGVVAGDVTTADLVRRTRP